MRNVGADAAADGTNRRDDMSENGRIKGTRRVLETVGGGEWSRRGRG